MFSFQRSLIALVGVLVIVGTLATLMPLVSFGQGNNPIVARLQPRKFYLTQTGHTGSQALTACASGYHMASLWEIHDPSNLRYDTQQGLTRDDSGFGPPTVIRGWIRTGNDASSMVTPGTGNCQAWTSADSSDIGTNVSLSVRWDETATVVSPWVATPNTCGNDTIHVWCVQD